MKSVTFTSKVIMRQLKHYRHIIRVYILLCPKYFEDSVFRYNFYTQSHTVCFCKYAKEQTDTRVDT